MMDNFILFAVVLGIGMLGGTARYLHEVGMHDGHFRFFKYFSYAMVGGFIATISGFLSTHWGISGPLQNGLVGLAALASPEIIALVPKLFSQWIKRQAQSL